MSTKVKTQIILRNSEIICLLISSEAWRVNEFFKAGEKGESLETLGALMTASHDSLRDLYDCSHPDLDRLVTIGNEFRYGARLTGAGYESHRCVFSKKYCFFSNFRWGGCSVALTSPENAEKYMEALKKEFYTGHENATGKNVEVLVFLTEPQEGATIIVA